MNPAPLLVATILMLPSVMEATDRSTRPAFNPGADLLVAQFDGKPDADDVHALAALGCLLAHPDFAGVETYGVMFAYGTQKSDELWDMSEMMNRIFGAEGPETWTNAFRGDGMERWNSSVERIAARVTPVLRSGGHVWVQEAGQSDITRAWLERVIREDNGITAADTRARVHVVQHSEWNERHTTVGDLEQVRRNADYIKIDDGNGDGPNNQTPKYLSADSSFMRAAAGADNPNRTAAALWSAAGRLIGDWKADYSVIGRGGVDFSDCVENWWIFALGDRAGGVDAFWKRYVVNTPDA